MKIVTTSVENIEGPGAETLRNGGEGGDTTQEILQCQDDSDDDSGRNNRFKLSSDQRNGDDEEEDGENFSKRLRMAKYKHIDLPPPLELIAKSVYKEEEPVKTGAPIAFLSLAQMAGGHFRQEELCGVSREERKQQLQAAESANSTKPL